MFPETPYKPKLLKKAPSMRAINNYNNMRTSLDSKGDEEHAYDNYMFYGDDDTTYTSKVDPSEMTYHNYANDNSNMGTLRINDHISTGKIYVNSGVYGNSQNILPVSTIGNETDIAMYDYATWKSSTGTGVSSSETDPTHDTNSRKDDLGSTSKLVSAKVKTVSLNLGSRLIVNKLFVGPNDAQEFRRIYTMK